MIYIPDTLFYFETTACQPSKATAVYTRCSAIAERPRCRVRYSFRQK